MSAGFRALLNSFLRMNRQQRRAQGKTQHYRLSLETLEERAVPAAYYFSNPTPAALQSTIDLFKAKLAGPLIDSLNQVAAASGYRDVGFDGLSNGVINPLAGNYFTQAVSRGLLLSTPGSGFQVSQQAGGSQRFGNIDPSYTDLFTTFSATQLLTPIGSRITDVTFTDPQNPQNTGNATVRGFGAIFSDVDDANSTKFEAFGLVGGVETSLTGVRNVQVMNNGLSFFGVVFSEGERITRVRLTSGNAALTAGQLETGGADLVVLDNMLYSQPQPNTTRFYKWNNAAPNNANWNNPANWTLTSGNPAPAPAQAFPQNIGDIAVFGDNLTSNKIITVPPGTFAVGSMQFDTARNVTFNGDGEFNFAASGNDQPQAALELLNNNSNAIVNFNVPVQFTNTWQVTTLGTSRAQFLQPLSGGTNIIQRGTARLTGSTLANINVALDNGVLEGSGHVNGINFQPNTTNVIAPGTSEPTITTGIVTVDENLTLNNSTTVRLKIRGTNSNQYDQLIVNGDINLNNAKLELDLGTYIPAVGATFNIIDSNQLTGQFAQSSVITVNNMTFYLAYNQDGLILTRSIPVSIALSPASATKYGQDFTFKTTVTSPIGDPDGNVVFSLISGGTTINSVTKVLNAAGEATVNLTDFASVPTATTYKLRVSYKGSGQYLPNDRDFDNALVVSAASTATTLGNATGIAGQLITSIAIVNVITPGVGSPLGKVRFTINGLPNPTEVDVVDVGGEYQATLERNDLAAGTYTYTAEYLGSSGKFISSISGQETITVNKATAKLELKGNATSIYADNVTFRAEVSSLPPSTLAIGGNVLFSMYKDGSKIGESKLVAVTNGVALFTVPADLQLTPTQTLLPGQYKVTAKYEGDTNYEATLEQNIPHEITKAQTITTVELLPLPDLIATYGELLTFRASVKPVNSAAGIPTGTVIFSIRKSGSSVDIVTSGKIGLNALGTADYTPPLTLLPTEGGAPLQVIATYQEDDTLNRFLNSSNVNSPLLQTILRADTAITFTMTRVSDNATSDFRYSDSVILKATVTVVGLDAASKVRVGDPEGEVEFYYLKTDTLGDTTLVYLSSVNLDSNSKGEAVLDKTIFSDKVRLPTGNNQQFRIKYKDKRITPVLNSKIAEPEFSVRPLKLELVNGLNVAPKTGTPVKNNKYAYGRSLVISLSLKPEAGVTLTPGKLINNKDVETTPNISGFSMEFSGITTTSSFKTTSNLTINDPPRSDNIRVLKFISGVLFNSSIFNRNPAQNKSTIITAGKFTTVTVKIDDPSKSINYSLAGDKLEINNNAGLFEVIGLGRRWIY